MCSLHIVCHVFPVAAKNIVVLMKLCKTKTVKINQEQVYMLMLK